MVHMIISQKKFFGPVLAIQTFRTIEEVIEKQIIFAVLSATGCGPKIKRFPYF